MTEAEWNGCTDPQKMLEFLRGKASDRKLRLFAVACCRRVWHLLADERSRKAVEVAERYADMVTVSGDDLDAARQAAEDAAEAKAWDSANDLDTWDAWANAATAARNTLMGDMDGHSAWIASSAPAFYQRMMPAWVVSWTAGEAAGWGNEEPDVQSEQQANVLRDIFGPLPFRPTALDPPWLTPTVKSLATAIYADRAFDRLPILADALEDAGCTNADILSHCRGPGPHVLGCWVVDLLLGKK